MFFVKSPDNHYPGLIVSILFLSQETQPILTQPQKTYLFYTSEPFDSSRYRYFLSKTHLYFVFLFKNESVVYT